MIFYSFITCIIAALGISWFKFFQAATNPGLLYLPLESYFFTAKFGEGTELYNRPHFFLSYFDYKPPGTERIINEVFIWVFCILAILLLIQIMSCHEWFKPQGSTEVPVIGKLFKRLSVALQSKNNIFNFDFPQITLISFCFAAVFLFMIPSDSSDMYGYLARGAQQIDYGLNPYHQTVSEIANWWDKPLLANINSIWSYNPAPYGPVYMLLYAGLAFLSMGNFYVALFIFKFFNLGVFACLLLILAQILNDADFEKEFFSKKFSDARQIFSYKKIIYSLIAFNPFIMVEILWNGHNDLLMGMLVLLSLFLCFKNKFNSSIIVLTLSILSKYLSIVLLPFFIIYYFAKGIRSFPIYGTLISSALVSFCWNYYAPFAGRMNDISHNLLLCHKSLQRSFNTIYKAIIGHSLPAEVNLAFIGLFALCMMFLIYKFIYTENKRLNIFHYSFLAMFLLIFIFSAKFHSWYLLMLLPFAVLIHPRFMLLLSLSHLISLTFLDQANVANFVVMTAIPSVIYFRYLVKHDL